MGNQNKVEVVNSLTQKMDSASAIYFTRYTGIDVGEMTRLRKQFRDNGVDYFVSKNTLTKIAAKNAGFEEEIIDSLCNGQIGIAYTKADPTSPAKVIKDFTKDNEDCLEVKGFFIDGDNGRVAINTGTVTDAQFTVVGDISGSGDLVVDQNLKIQGSEVDFTNLPVGNPNVLGRLFIEEALAPGTSQIVKVSGG